MEGEQFTATVYGLIKETNYAEAVRELNVSSPPGPSTPIYVETIKDGKQSDVIRETGRAAN